MTASQEQRSKTTLMRQRAWELHVGGAAQFAIAAELGVTQGRVSQLIKQAAAAHPVNKLDIGERIALSEERWNLSELEIREAIKQQRQHGRTTTTVIRYPDGKEQIQTEVRHGVDPALLRALSTHHDRRARQLNNQLAPEAGVQQVNLNLIQDFLQQGDAPAGKLSAADWNDQQVLDAK